MGIHQSPQTFQLLPKADVIFRGSFQFHVLFRQLRIFLLNNGILFFDEFTIR